MSKSNHFMRNATIIALSVPALAIGIFVLIQGMNSRRIMDSRNREMQAAAPCFVGDKWTGVTFTPSGDPAWAVDTGSTSAGYSAVYHGTDAKAVAQDLTNCLQAHGFSMKAPTDHTVDYFNNNPTAHPGAPAATPAPDDTWEVSGQTDHGDLGGSLEVRPDGILRVSLGITFMN